MDEEERHVVDEFGEEQVADRDGIPDDEHVAEHGGKQAEEPEADAVTGASPGTAQACSDLGLNSLEENLNKFGIKPPGVS